MPRTEMSEYKGMHGSSDDLVAADIKCLNLRQIARVFPTPVPVFERPDLTMVISQWRPTLPSSILEP
jgi:hypothetical protein